MNEEQRNVFSDMEANIRATESLMDATRTIIQDPELNKLMDQLQGSLDAQRAVLEKLKL